MSFLIREMVKSDIKHVQDVAKHSWHSTYDGIIPRDVQDNFLNLAYSDDMMEKRVKGSYVFVAEMDGNVVGFSNFSEVNDEGQSELSAIYLYQNCQGQEIGTALLEKGIEVLDDLKQIYIDVEKENTFGKTFYDAKGFKTIKEYDDPFDGHILKTVRMCLTV